MNRHERRRARAVKVDRLGKSSRVLFDVARGPDDRVHAFRIDAMGETMATSVCGVARTGDVDDSLEVCGACGPWMLQEAGSDDPKKEYRGLCRRTGGGAA